MRKIIAAAGAGMALFAGLGTGIAQADPDLFTYRAMEERMCGYLDSRPTLQAFSNLSYGARVAGWPPGQEGLMVRRAVRDICPRHTELGDRWADMSPAPDANPSDTPQFPPFAVVH